MKYFTIAELCASNTADSRNVDNAPTTKALENLTTLVDKILDPVRERWGKPLAVNSGYRCLRLNDAVGGAATSQHMLGEAADITAGGWAENSQLFALVREMAEARLISFDQLIIYGEGRFLHISYRDGRNRRQILHK